LPSDAPTASSNTHHLASEWQPVHAFIPLQPNEIQIWRIDLPQPASTFEACLSLLNADESARANRIRHALTRQHFVLGRASLRRLLAYDLSLTPEAIPLTATSFGKPELSLPNAALSFNVAHSANTILIALSRHGRIGIDVEHINPTTDFLKIAQHSFTPTENATLNNITNLQDRRTAFYRGWTQKEAVAKADGRGLSLSTTSFEVPLSPTHSWPVAIATSTYEPAPTFYLTTLPLDETTAASLATDTPTHKLRLLRFPVG